VRLYAPIAVFVYKRLEHFQNLVTSLQLNEEYKSSDLYIFCDGNKNLDDLICVLKVRSYAKNLYGFKSVQVVEQSKNIGLSNSILYGINYVFLMHTKIIVLEDDLVVSPFFLEFMNDALDGYKDNLYVSCISGYLPPINVSINTPFFLRFASSWGWATWKKSWRLFEEDGLYLKKQLILHNLVNEFNLNGAFENLKMLDRQIRKKNDSWAIRWDASILLSKTFCLYPNHNLVTNQGVDGSGANCLPSDNYLHSKFKREKIKIHNFENVEENIEMKKKYEKFYKYYKPSLFKKIFLRLKNKVYK
jgi:hypothetical protein